MAEVVQFAMAGSRPDAVAMWLAGAMLEGMSHWLEAAT
jgi:hypothetical protein